MKILEIKIIRCSNADNIQHNWYKNRIEDNLLVQDCGGSHKQYYVLDKNKQVTNFCLPYDDCEIIQEFKNNTQLCNKCYKNSTYNPCKFILTLSNFPCINFEIIPKKVLTDSKNYSEIGKEIGELVDKKQEAYGDAFHKSQEIIEVLYPNGIKIEQYQDVLIIVRIIDKLFRIANKKEAFKENPYKDIAGYGILGSK